MEEKEMSKKRNHHNYTEEEVKFIMDNYLTMTYAEIGNVIGVSQKAIALKIMNMGMADKIKKTSMHGKGYRVIGSRARATYKYHSMRGRIKRANPKKDRAYMGKKVLVSKEDFIEWFMPRDFEGASVDRIDSKGDYSLDNMQVISMHDNIVKAKKGCAKAHDGVCVCFACGKEKPLDLFVKSKRRPFGHLTLCLDCHREQSRIYRLKKKQKKINNQ